jgi:hypothetical protein
MDVLLLTAMAATAIVGAVIAIWVVPALVLAVLATATDEPA